MGKLVVLMGPTGAGKSVQGDLLAEFYGGVHLSSGRLLRQDAHAAARIVDGRLAPADEVHRVIGDAIERVPVVTPVVLDGTPRTHADVVWLEANLTRFRRELVAVVLIDLDLGTSLQRLSTRGRADDAPEAVRAKWDLFNEVTYPVVDHYRELGLLVTVDGRGSIETVHEHMKAALAGVFA